MTPYIASIPVPDAVGSGNYATNAYLYVSDYPAPGFVTQGPGAFLIWYQEREIKARECNTTYLHHYDGYWYCYEFLGR